MRSSEKKYYLKLILLFAGMLTGASGQPKPLTPAFPGAEGFGATAQGGRNGEVIYVTNLRDYSSDEQPVPGSLRFATETHGPRYILFRVSGIINLKDELEILEPFVTIAGQTAPGDGICLKNHGLRIRTHNVIIQHLRVRPGDIYGKSHKGWSTDAITVSSPSQNVIIDHCSASWANDEVLSVSGADITNVTIQYCIVSESLNKSTHSKGAHGYGSLLRIGGRMSYHHNILAHHVSRTPRTGSYGNHAGRINFCNNLIYNSVKYGYTAKDSSLINYVGNYIKQGPSSEKDFVFETGGEATKIFASCNLFLKYKDDEIITDPEKIINTRNGGELLNKALGDCKITLTDTENLPFILAQSCGAVLPKRDPVDKRIIREIKTGKGNIIDSQDEVGGWPEYRSISAPVDSDLDGMPDEWERNKGLDPENPRDYLDNNLSKRYNNLEVYLHSLNDEFNLKKSA